MPEVLETKKVGSLIKRSQERSSEFLASLNHIDYSPQFFFDGVFYVTHEMAFLCPDL